MSDQPENQTATEQLKLSTVEPILTDKDYALFMGSGELKPCPFCGHLWPISGGERTPNGRAICWKVQCTHSRRLVPDCCASVWHTDPDKEKARAGAVAKWNRRPEAK